MLSIGRMSLGQEGYYNALAREDYFLEGGEPPGRWAGEAAEEFGLTGQVQAQDLTDIFGGQLGGKSLVQTGGQFQRCPGWDLTFSAVKSLSTAWSQADPETARRIQECQQAAVEKALAYVEAECGVTRRGKGGTELEKVKCLFATFEHGTSRAQQPQLHTHCLMMNVGIREDGSTGTLRSDFIYKHKMAAGAIYRAELACLLGEELGFETMLNGSTFDVIGVDQKLCEHFSERRRQIEEALEQRGETGAVASASLALRTRTNKENVPRAELQKEWKEIGQQFGFSSEDVQKLIQTDWKTEQDRSLLAKLSVREGAEELIDSNSTFTERDLVRYTAQAAQGRQIGADQVLEAVEEHLSTSPEIMALGVIDQEAHFTTRAHYELEKVMLHKAEKMLAGESLSISPGAISQAITNVKHPLTAEQETAVRHVLEGAGRIGAITGDAGTGKTTILNPIREALEQSGYEVRGAALAGKAAEGMQEGSAIASQTIKSLIWTLDRIEQGWSLEQAKQDFDQWVQEKKETMGELLADRFNPQFTEKTAQKSRASFDKFIRDKGITNRTVIVVDEAAMVDTKNTAKLIDHAEKAGAKLVFIGDQKQLQSIQAGGFFGKVSELTGGVRLTEIFRQRHEDEKQAVRNMASVNVREALTHYAEKGNLVVADTRRNAQEQLVDAWAERGVKRPADSLILAGTNLDVVNINREAQQRRMDAGVLGEKAVKLGSYEIRTGDRVVFTRRDQGMGVENGSFGTVKSISPHIGTMSVELDGGGSPGDRRRTFSVNTYRDVKLGYASTTHKAQGSTFENAFVMTDESMIDHQISYVQMSRAREETKIYTTRDQAGDSLRDLVRQMERDRQKQLAVEMERKAVQQNQSSLSLGL